MTFSAPYPKRLLTKDTHRQFVSCIPNSYQSSLKVTVCLFLLLAVTGCAVGPNYRKQETEPASLSVTQQPAVFSDASPTGAWWSQFDDPVLAGLVEEALSSNLDLRIAIARLRESRAALTEQRLNQLPHVTAGGSYDRRDQQQNIVPGRTLTETYTVGFDAFWELDVFGGPRRATERAGAIAQATEADLQDVQVTIASEVARNYFELRGVQKRFEISRSSLKNLQDTQRVTRTRWELGAGSELDVQSSIARMKSIEAQIPLLEVAEAQYKYRLATLLGQRPGSLNARLAPQPSLAFARPLPLGDTRNLLRNRPDVRAAERRLAAATAHVGVATADLYPRISLSGFIGFLSGDSRTLFQSAGQAWALTPSIQWTAFDLGSVRARLRASEARAEGTLAEYEHTVLLALEDAQNALNAYGMQQSRIKIIEAQTIAARRAEFLAQARFNEGSEEYLTLLDAQRTRLAAEDSLAQTETQVNVNVVAVYKALGGHLQESSSDTTNANR